MSSSSLRNPGYWWYRARSLLLERALGGTVGSDALILDVGSADGPSVGWLAGRRVVPLDIEPEGLPIGGVCASGLRLPFRDGTFDVVCAFDVIEHFSDDRALVLEMRRVVRSQGQLLVSVPAYQWAWSPHDDAAGHQRRYTRRELVSLLTDAGLKIDKATYAFCATFPLFLGERLLGRFRGSVHRPADPKLPMAVERILLSMTRLDAAVLPRADLPFGSSVLAAAVRAD